MNAADHPQAVDVDETRVVDRRGSDAGRDEVGDTVVVDRAPLAVPDGVETADEGEVGVGGEVEDTVVVDHDLRAARATAGDTVVVERTVVRPIEPPAGSPDGIMHEPARRGTRPGAAPVPDEVLGYAEVGSGPGLLEHYAVRGEPRAPVAPPRASTRPAIDAPTRDPAAVLPSVARRSRRSARLVLVAFGASIVVAAAGLVVVGVLAFAG
ncbi:hypothetical protein [Agromyces sp. NPDC058110]|uniref:hypothetical protein n=1 Tax=Agromyces sp. NPDC058110 TaxID=3346345 RepID=UPI0036D7CEBA